MEVRFVVLSPSGKHRVVPVRLPILLGRGEDAKFRIQKDSVSRRHCEFLLKDDAVHVRDLGSTNGTLLDGAQIAASVATLVPPGTVVNVGDIFIRVEYESAAEPTPAQTDGGDTRPLTAMPATEPEAEPVEVAAAAEPAAPAPDFPDLPAAEPAVEEVAWQADDAAAPPPADDTSLDDFFKSLS